jgi:hypothetical protein
MGGSFRGDVLTSGLDRKKEAHEATGVHRASHAGWPLTTHAQQTAKLPTIGFIGTSLSGYSAWTAVFAERLHELG